MLTAQFSSVFPVVFLFAVVAAILIGPHSQEVFSWIMAWKKRAKVIVISSVKRNRRVPEAA